MTNLPHLHGGKIYYAMLDGSLILMAALETVGTGTTALNLGFTLPYRGTNYNPFTVCSNDFFSFGSTAGSPATSNVSLPTNSLPVGSVALLWDDLLPTPPSSA